MSDKYGGLRTSTIYNANITNYIICDDDFDQYQPIVSFERFGEIVNCKLRFSGLFKNKCRSLNEIKNEFPYGSDVELYLNTQKTPYCVTKHYLEENAYLGYIFLTTDMCFVCWIIVTFVIVYCYDKGCFNCKRLHSNTLDVQSNTSNVHITLTV
jgi:hypothetical protein